MASLTSNMLYTHDGNTEKTSMLFYKRSLYEERYSFNSEYRNVTNFNFGEKFLYGRVSRLFVPIEPTQTNRTLKSFSAHATAGDAVKAFDFVVDAFNDMAQQFQKCAYTGKIDTKDPYLTNLLIYKAYESPATQYQNYYKGYKAALASQFKSKKIKVRNFQQFINELTAMLERTTSKSPFTYPAFIKSRRCSIMSSGLAIEIADLDPANDYEKYSKFMESNNWEFYLNLCRTYGFMVDQFIPWRIVADIGSSPMVEYATAYGPTSTDAILRSYYRPASTKYYDRFKNVLLSLYNTVKPRKIMEVEYCNGRAITHISRPQEYNLNLLEQTLGEEYFLKLYFQLRFKEEESEFTQNEREHLIDDLIELYQATGKLWKTIPVFERILNKTFDYSGSLSYIMNARKNSN